MDVGGKRIKFTQKQKVLMHLLAAWGGEASELEFHKLLFFFCRREISAGLLPTFEFFPHLKGGYSFSAWLEKEKLVEMGFLEDRHKYWTLTDRAVNIPEPGRKAIVHIQQTVRKYDTFGENDLVREMYINYPIYATRSTIAEKILADRRDMLQYIETLKPSTNEKHLYTIGYEGISLEEYFMRLYENGVTVLCDVRRVPFSHKKGFSKNKLSDLCNKAGMEYRHIPELGIASSRRTNLNDQSDYDALFADYQRYDLPGQQHEVDKLAALIQQGKCIALTCFEADPYQCHRRFVAERIAQMLGCSLTHLTLPSSLASPCQQLLVF